MSRLTVILSTSLLKMKGSSASAPVAPPSAYTAQALATRPVSAPAGFMENGLCYYSLVYFNHDNNGRKRFL